MVIILGYGKVCLDFIRQRGFFVTPRRWLGTVLPSPSADFTAKLVDVHADGVAYNVCDGIIRRAYRHDPAPAAIAPVAAPVGAGLPPSHEATEDRRSLGGGGKTGPYDDATEITISLWPTSMVFRRGHRIRLEVAGSNFPRFDRNPNTGEPSATARTIAPATQVVHHGRQAPSRIMLPLIPAPR